MCVKGGEDNEISPKEKYDCLNGLQGLLENVHREIYYLWGKRDKV